jgi:phage baseplate assembly protein W
MADGITYGINFPFRDSERGDFLQLTEFQSQQIRADLIHLLLTRKGSRYYLPDFGTRLYEYIFEPFDTLTFDALESDIRDSVSRYMPNLLINQITIEPAEASSEADQVQTITNVGDARLYDIYRVPGKGTSEYTAKVKIDYSTNGQTFAESDFIIINI